MTVEVLLHYVVGLELLALKALRVSSGRKAVWRSRLTLAIDEGGHFFQIGVSPSWFRPVIVLVHTDVRLEICIALAHQHPLIYTSAGSLHCLFLMTILHAKKRHCQYSIQLRNAIMYLLVILCSLSVLLVKSEHVLL